MVPRSTPELSRRGATQSPIPTPASLNAPIWSRKPCLTSSGRSQPHRSNGPEQFFTVGSVKPFKGFTKTTISTLASAAHAGRYLNCVYRSCFLRGKKNRRAPKGTRRPRIPDQGEGEGLEPKFFSITVARLLRPQIRSHHVLLLAACSWPFDRSEINGLPDTDGLTPRMVTPVAVRRVLRRQAAAVRLPTEVPAAHASADAGSRTSDGTARPSATAPASESREPAGRH